MRRRLIFIAAFWDVDGGPPWRSPPSGDLRKEAQDVVDRAAPSDESVLRPARLTPGQPPSFVGRGRAATRFNCAEHRLRLRRGHIPQQGETPARTLERGRGAGTASPIPAGSPLAAADQVT